MHEQFGSVRVFGPDFLGYERHERVQHNEALIQRPTDRGARFLSQFGIVRSKQGLGELQIPVAEFAPNETVKCVRGFVELVCAQRVIHGFANSGSLADHPFVDCRVDLCRIIGLSGDAFIHFREARRIPDLRRKVSVSRDAALRELKIATHGRHRRQGEAHGVRAVFLDQVEGINDVSE